MRKILIFALFILILSNSNAFSDSFRCGPQSIVHTGFSKGDVLAQCGEPDYKDIESVDTRGTYGGSRYGGRKYCPPGGSFSAVSSPIETWYYNCGEGDFTYSLKFKDGGLVQIITGARGSGPKRCR